MKKTNKCIELILCLSLGWLGLHRFYAGKKYAWLYVFTCGLFGLGWFVDSLILLSKALFRLIKDTTPQKARNQTTDKAKLLNANNTKKESKAYWQKLLATDHSRIICLDIETTGVDKTKDEIVQLSLINGNGKVLFNSYIKPTNHAEWPEAEAIHGITPGMVANNPTIMDVLPAINAILANAELIVGYNSDKFDIPFLKNNGVIFPTNVTTTDVMLEFAPIYGEWNDYHKSYRWQKLTTCAKYYGYEFKAHDSLEDVRATLYCFYRIAEEYASGER